MSTRTLLQVFDEQFQHVKFDHKLTKAIYRYQVGYVNRNQDHMEFFGSNLLGVHVVRFKDSDVGMFFDEVLDVDYQKLLKEIRSLTTINHDFKVAADVFNLTCMYVIHRLMLLDQKNQDIKRAMFDTGLVFFYRCIAALISDRFRYPADPHLATRAYANLSGKYLIKKLGTWYKVMEYRSNDLIDPDGIHWKNLMSFKDDLSVLYAISDSQGRIRDLVKNYYNELKMVHASGDKIATTGSTYLDVDGEETTKDKVKSTESYVTYLRTTLADERTFIKDDLINVVVHINSNTSFRMVRLTLEWLVQHYSEGKYNKKIDEFASLVVVQSMHFVDTMIEPSKKKDLGHVLVTLKNLYLSTRTTDPEVEKIRTLGAELIEESRKGMSSSLVLATRTSIILYMTLRALVGHLGGK